MDNTQLAALEAAARESLTPSRWNPYSSSEAALLLSLIERLRKAERWMRAIDDEMVIHEIDTIDSFDDEREGVRTLLDLVVSIAIDPKCNGGKELRMVGDKPGELETIRAFMTPHTSANVDRMEVDDLHAEVEHLCGLREAEAPREWVRLTSEEAIDLADTLETHLSNVRDIEAAVIAKQEAAR